MEVIYACKDCGEISNSESSMLCDKCGGELRGSGCPGIHGTRDSFGVGKAFVDEKSGDVIDTWGKWEKHGYRKVDKHNFKNENVREAFEKKQEELKGQKLPQLKETLA